MSVSIDWEIDVLPVNARASSLNFSGVQEVHTFK